ncbi:hypothetical protein [Shewanella putrefaciens]|uniref:hypothetical protein n=1 Tax=Shewanella TaxID=22 RepID=UPI00005D0CCE|nr:hypothetical protein [Shewanella putrefaciens]QGS48427.1 hypothetical protein FOB89_05640 [Shewanella putrefaciens]
MNVLESMTDAPPETRLLLLQWATLQGGLFIGGDIQDLSKLFKMPKRTITAGLHYLVQEGYMLKFPNLDVSPSSDKPRSRFHFQLTIEGYRRSQDTLAACGFHEELRYVLFGTSLKLPRQGIRLQWACLVLLANKAGYAIGYSTETLKKWSGLSDKQLEQNWNFLVKAGEISLVAKEVKNSDFFVALPTMYKIRPRSVALNCVNFGVPVQQNHLQEFNFLRDVISFNHKFQQQQQKQQQIPLQNSVLDDKSYLAMAKGFLDPRLRVYIHHLCVSTVLLGLSHEKVLDTSQDILKNETLQRFIRSALEYGLCMPESLVISAKGLHSKDCNVQQSTENDTAHLIDFALKALTDELMFKIAEFAPFLRLFVREYKVSPNFVGWLPGHSMHSTRTIKFAKVEKKSEQTEALVGDDVCSEQQSREEREFTTFVLQLWLPASAKVKDSMALGAQILTYQGWKWVNSPNIVQVNDIKIHKMRFGCD